MKQSLDGTAGRAVGPVTELDQLVPGDHVCWAVASEADHREVLTEYYVAGVRAGDRLAYFAHRRPPETVLGYLADAGLPVADLLATGQLVVLDARAVYTPSGSFEAPRVVADLAAATRSAVADGFRALRAAGEVEWLVPEMLDVPALAAYELEADGVAAGSALIGLCAYDARHCPAESLAAVAAVHPSRLGEIALQFCVYTGDDGAVAVAGEVDVDDAATFRSALRAVIDREPGAPLVLDLTALAFIDLGGLCSLAALAATGRDVRIVGASALVRRCWSLLEFDRLGNIVFN